MTSTPKIALPLLAAGQAQKHVTMNEALLVLDGLVQAVVEAAPSDIPPEAPTLNSCWLIGSTPTGAWAGQGGHLAFAEEGGWRFQTPAPGWSARRADDLSLYVFDGSGWGPAPGPAMLENLSRLGVGAAADGTNPFVAKLNNALMTALPASEGGSGDLRLAINKVSAGDTASLIFQTNFSGRAEIGLAGDDDLAFKVSPDGVSWTSSIVLDRASGVASFPTAPQFRASVGDDAYAAADTWVVVPFDTVDHDPRSDLDLTAHTYVVPVDGFYVFGAQVAMLSDGTPPTVAYAAFAVDGEIALESRIRTSPPTSSRGHAVLTLARHLVAGTVVDVRSYFSGQDSNFAGDACQFWGFRVG